MPPGTKLRSGYTTGACAAAAAQAATALFFFGNRLSEVSLCLPDGNRATLAVDESVSGDGFAACAVIKDAGGDRDVTDGIKIWATIRSCPEGIRLKGGEGVGTVTAPGLAAKVGEPAINPVPRRMIIGGVAQELAGRGAPAGAEITISAEGGEKIAKKTFNPKLGIVGGISILGTKGIVRPMSDDSWKSSLLPQIDQALALGFDKLVLTFGNLGETAAQRAGFSKRQTAQMSNFVGFMLQGCLERKVKEVLLLGHLGKMIKIADGHFNTHSRIAPQKLELLKEIAKSRSAPEDIVEALECAKSAEAAIDILNRNSINTLLDEVADLVADQAGNYLKQQLPVSAAITNLSGKIVGISSGARSILASISENGARN